MLIFQLFFSLEFFLLHAKQNEEDLEELFVYKNNQLKYKFIIYLFLTFQLNLSILKLNIKVALL